MTPEERDRLTRLEAWKEMLTGQVRELREDFALQIVNIRNDHVHSFAEINGKLDVITAKLEQGKGAWWAVTKIFGAIVVVLGIATAVVQLFSS